MKLSYLDQTGHLTPDKLEQTITKYAPLLEKMKGQQGLDPMGTGWMEIDRWAGEEELSRLEEIAREIRETSDAFVGDRGRRVQQRRPVDGKGPAKAGNPGNRLGRQHPFGSGHQPDARLPFWKGFFGGLYRQKL